MSRFLLDTGIASAYINRRGDIYQQARDRVVAGHRIGIALPVLAELWYGVEKSASRNKNAARLRRILPEFTIWPLTEEGAEEYGRIAAELKRLGRPIGKIDMLIAAIALSLGNTTVVSADLDLKVVSGLKVENWTLP